MKKVIEKVIIIFLITFLFMNIIFQKSYYIYAVNPNIIVTTDIANFEMKIQQWLESKLQEYTNNEEKIYYISKFANDYSWQEEIAGSIEYGSLDIEECNQKVIEISGNMIKQFEMYSDNKINIESARVLLINYLATLKTEKEKELGDIDETSKNKMLQEYFQDLKSKFTRR